MAAVDVFYRFEVEHIFAVSSRLGAFQRRARGLRLAAGLVLVMLAVALTGCDWGNLKFRYRLTVEVAVDGEVKSASSIIEVTYYGKGEFTRYNSYYRGVAPVVDLGRHGMLVAAMAVDFAEYARRKREYGLTCKLAKDASNLPDVFHLDAADLVKLRTGKRELADGGYPAFIWFPDGAPYERAQQICPEEFSRVIGANVVLRSVTMEIAPDAPVKTRLELTAPWLDEIRVDQKTTWDARDGIFKPRRQGAIETDTARP
jgi:hypothetical protein